LISYELKVSQPATQQGAEFATNTARLS
jgi:hypothetical protein